MEAGLPTEIAGQLFQKARKRTNSLSQKRSSSVSDFEEIDIRELDRRTTFSADSIHELGRDLNQNKRHSLKSSFRRTFKGVKKMFHGLHAEQGLYKATSTPNMAKIPTTPFGKHKKKHLSSTSEGVLDEAGLQSNREIRQRKVSWANKIDTWLEDSANVSPYTVRRREENILATSPLTEHSKEVLWLDVTKKNGTVENLSNTRLNNVHARVDSHIVDEQSESSSLQNSGKVENIEQITCKPDNNLTNSTHQKVINSTTDKLFINTSTKVVELIKQKFENTHGKDYLKTSAEKANNIKSETDILQSTVNTKKMTTASITPRAQLYVIENHKLDYNNNNSSPTNYNQQRNTSYNDNKPTYNGINTYNTSNKIHDKKSASPQNLLVPKSDMFSFDDIDINLQEHVDYLQRSLTAPRKNSKKYNHGLPQQDKENLHFSMEDIKKIVESVIHIKLGEKKFDSKKVTTWCKEISNDVRDELKILTRNRKKVVATTYIGSKLNGSQVHVSVKCQKNINTDDFLTVALEGDDMYIWVTMLMADY